MALMTVLAMAQDILSDLSDDYINSLNDTESAEQVAQILKTTYYEIIEQKTDRWPHLKDMITLDPSGETARPTHMKIPISIYNMLWLKYNKRKSTDTRDKFSEIEYMLPEEFVNYVNSRDNSVSNYETVSDYSGITLTIRNDQAPTYYTSFDDEYLVFDSYDSGVDTTLQSAKTQAYVVKIPSWESTDTFVPDLPAQAFSYFLAEAKSTAFNTLKQMPNQKEEQRAARLKRHLNQNDWRVNPAIKKRQFGRRSRK